MKSGAGKADKNQMNQILSVFFWHYDRTPGPGHCKVSSALKRGSSCRSR